MKDGFIFLAFVFGTGTLISWQVVGDLIQDELMSMKLLAIPIGITILFLVTGFLGASL